MSLYLFLAGEDSIEDVREIRNSIRKTIASGTAQEWTANNITVKKVIGFDQKEVLEQCNLFLRLYDPTVKAANPTADRTIPFIRY